MPLFIAIAALLALATFVWVLHPLWRTRRLPVFAAIAGLCVAVGLLYFAIGTPRALDPAQSEQPKTIDEAIARLEAELERSSPSESTNQIDGLRLLARAYAQQQQPTRANNAYERALKLAPDDAELLAEAAQARAMGDPQRRFDDAAIAQLQQALRVQPMHQRARWFLGIAQRQRGEHAEAAKTWEPLLAVVDANTAAALRPQLDAARSDAGLPPLPAPTPATPSPNAIIVRLRIDPSLAERTPSASVFVIARVPGGPPMPVAVEKHPLSALPDTLTLDDADGPMPTQKLSALKEVEVFARVSQSGNAMRQDGDVESSAVRVTLPTTTPIELRLP